MPSIINASSSGSGGIVQTADASGVLQLQSNGTTALTVSGSTVTFAGAPSLPAGSITQASLASGVAGTGPAFSAYMSTTQSITTSVWTKAQFNAEFFDTNSNYDTTNYRFTPTVAGYYAVNYALSFTTGAATGLYSGIYKNGSRIRYVVAYGGSNALDDWTTSGANLLYMNGTTDYIECWGLQVSGTPAFNGGVEVAWFEASLVRAA